MVHIHPVAVDLANEYAKYIIRHSGRHEKKAPGCPSVRLPVNLPVHKDRNLSDILSSSEDDSDKSSTVQAQVVNKMTGASSTNLAPVLTRTKSTTTTKHKSLAKRQRPPSNRRQPSRQIVKRSKRKK